MNVSVIVPVYNAADYVSQAVESALAQPETVEIILVEDASSDDSLNVCERLAAHYPTIKLFRHPDRGNHGEAASRNLAIRNSTCDYIACLDADDMFLPGRFTLDKELFTIDPSIDGVYGALGEYIESESARQRWMMGNRPIGNLTTVKRKVSPEQLYEKLIAGGFGYIHLNCVTVKRGVFNRTGLFNERLRLHTDTDMLWKMVAVAKLAPGHIDTPVALRRIHDSNTISSPRSPMDVYRTWDLLMREALLWGKENLSKTQLRMFQERYAIEKRTRLWTLFVRDPLANLLKRRVS